MLGKLFSGGAISSSAQIPLSFKIAGRQDLRLSADEFPEDLQAWRFLSHHIRRYPLDLRAHVQRILLSHNEHLTDRIEGSLLDLFIALGDAGPTFKASMLDLSMSHLSDDSQRLFTDLLENSTDNATGSHWFHGSVLATGENTETQTLLKQQKVEADNHYTSIQAEVQDCLEYGQIEIAQELLEREILAGRNTTELEEDLLAIYQHTRNGQRLNEITQLLNAEDMSISERWEQVQREAENW